MMLLRGTYDVLINVTWDCFDQSNFYISRINIIEWNIICSHNTYYDITDQNNSVSFECLDIHYQ